MFMPSARNWEEMKYEAAGCWPLPINSGDEFAFITKMPTSTIKAAYRSCPVSLTVATAETPEGAVMATTLIVADDPGAPLMLTGALRHEEEQIALENILRTGKTLVVFFDELSRPIARATCVLKQSGCAKAIELFEAAGRKYVGPWTALLSSVLDEVQAYADPQLAVEQKFAPRFVTVPLLLSDFVTIKATTVGLTDVLDFRLDDPDEGHGLEQSTWHLLENLFEGNIFHSPQVIEPSKARELTDILARCNAGLCLFEAKAAAMLKTDPDRSTERRLKSVQKQIDKGIGQLVGALKNIRAELPLRTKKDESKQEESIDIKTDVGVIRQGIVMISEMLPGLDWESIGQQLLAASHESSAMLHVLDLQELRMLVGVSQDEPVLLVAHLLRRFEIMNERKHAMIRTVLQGPPLP